MSAVMGQRATPTTWKPKPEVPLQENEWTDVGVRGRLGTGQKATLGAEGRGPSEAPVLQCEQSDIPCSGHVIEGL